MSTFRIDPDRAAHLAATYGTTARSVLSFCQSRDDDRPLPGETRITSAEIAYLARTEWVVTLADIVLRRTTLAIRGLLDLAVIDEIARIMSEERGWSPAEQERQKDDLLQELETYHGVVLDAPKRDEINRSRICV